jgi:hypothetical protein
MTNLDRRKKADALGWSDELRGFTIIQQNGFEIESAETKEQAQDAAKRFVFWAVMTPGVKRKNMQVPRVDGLGKKAWGNILEFANLTSDDFDYMKQFVQIFGKLVTIETCEKLEQIARKESVDLKTVDLRKSLSFQKYNYYAWQQLP